MDKKEISKIDLVKTHLCQHVHVNPLTMSMQGMKTVVLVEQMLVF